MSGEQARAGGTVAAAAVVVGAIVAGPKEIGQAVVEEVTGVDLSMVPSVKNGLKATFKKLVNPKNLRPTQEKHEMTGSVIKKLTKDMKKNGFDESKPISVVKTKSGRMHISDGHHRVEAAKRAKIDKIPANVANQ